MDFSTSYYSTHWVAYSKGSNIIDSGQDLLIMYGIILNIVSCSSDKNLIVNLIKNLVTPLDIPDMTKPRGIRGSQDNLSLMVHHFYEKMSCLAVSLTTL
jgi:hypothetical protein